MSFQSVADIIVISFQQLWLDFLGFVPTLTAALVVFVVGLIVAAALGSLVEKVVGALKLDMLLSKAGVEEYFSKAGVRLSVGRFFGRLTYWFVLIAFLLATSDILGFFSFSSFLEAVLLYIPQVVVAVLIMLAAIFVANFSRGVVVASAKSADLRSANFLGALTWWALIVFGLMAALSQLGIAITIINALVTGIIGMLALAGGLAFGLGGKEYASDLLKKFRNQVEHK